MSQNRLTEEQRRQLQERMARHPGGILEQVAHKENCSLADVIESLPTSAWTRASGEHFMDVLGAISAWGTPVTVIVHTADVIMEFTGPLPAGNVGHGFYNLSGSSGLHGHLSYQNCGAIYFLERPFMGKATASLVFANRDGQAMFKVYAGRDESGSLLADQVNGMRELIRHAATRELA
ncbi:heme utilization cystosolic carrier protein HutX [Uliginosibacterium sp. sgz301328]|uniref:heme utilization cystosolic carrier protein HutX n=1 Tax=Uliginosibacterium sp. sgz301328 TaxID=3243764 RepID=UPI00359D423B